MSPVGCSPETHRESFSANAQAARSGYEIARRVEVLVDEFLTDEMICGKRVLNVGCGLGYFSQRLSERGANVVATDSAADLVRETRERVGCVATVADACDLVEQFGEESFEVVVSSECIEHTSSPRLALRQMAAVVKPGGYLVVSTPNVLWSPVVKLATTMGLRPSDGFESFSSWSGIRDVLQQSNIHILRQKGLHLLPFPLPLHGISRWCDDHMQYLRAAMVNICIVGQKDACPLQKLTEIEESLAAVFDSG